jgi:hypothetical protein
LAIVESPSRFNGLPPIVHLRTAEMPVLSGPLTQNQRKIPVIA